MLSVQGIYSNGSVFCVQAVLSDLDRPLLCTSAHVEEQEQLEIPEAAMFIDMYSGQGLDFIVDSGQRVIRKSASARHAVQMLDA